MSLWQASISMVAASKEHIYWHLCKEQSGRPTRDQRWRKKRNRWEREIWQKSEGRHHNIEDTTKKVHKSLSWAVFIPPRQSLKAERENGKGMWNFKLRERALFRKCQRESMGFKSKSSKRPSGNSFPISAQWLVHSRCLGSSELIITPVRMPECFASFSQASLTWVKALWPVSTVSPEMQTFVSCAACAALSYFTAANRAWKTGANKMDKCGSEWTILLQLEVHGE